MLIGQEWHCPNCKYPAAECECGDPPGLVLRFRVPCPTCGEVQIPDCPHIVAADWDRLVNDESNQWAVSPFAMCDLTRIDELAAEILHNDQLYGSFWAEPINRLLIAWGTDHGGCYEMVLWENIYLLLGGEPRTVTWNEDGSTMKFWLTDDGERYRANIGDIVENLERSCKQIVSTVTGFYQ